MKREYKDYKFQILADETADFKHADVIAEKIAPLGDLPKDETDILEFMFENMLFGCTDEFINALLEDVNAGNIPDRIYNCYILDPNGEELEEFSTSVFLSELLEEYLYSDYINETKGD